MTQLLGIAKNTLLQTIRQPIYGIIVMVTLGGMALMPSLTGWTLDDDNKLLRDIGLSTLLIQGLFLAVFAASSVLDTEIEDKTVLTVAAKPISRPVFILGKFIGMIGALGVAHYLACLAFYMVMRHGVLQTAAETSDPTVLVFGPGMMLLVVVAAVAVNYLYDRRFLPTVIALALPAMTLSAGILLLVNREWKRDAYESAQPIERLPKSCEDPAVFRGLIFFRPAEGQMHLEGHRGELVHNDWKGPITQEEQEYLRGLHVTPKWRQDVDFLVEKTRKRQGIEISKASFLIFFAVIMLGSFALTASTRFGLMATFLICLLLLCAGLASDQVLKPLATGESASAWAKAAYWVLPNFQVFWMVDALSEMLVIPWDYVWRAIGYGLAYTCAVVTLGMSLFETREVG
ncbi:MAG: hypothetical protein DCC65_06890 [Planctomycetota bacterium]|nr:MAG: hypothetical protein DCC65_06890 [Planctomycetota bacterium]